LKEIFDKQLINIRRDRFASADKENYILLDEIYKILLEKIHGNFDSIFNLGAYRGELLNHLNNFNINFKDIIHSDISFNMLSQIPGKKVVADEEYLPFKSDTFDLIVSAMTLHHINDLHKTFIQINNILKKNGIFIANIFGPQTLVELKQAIINAEKDIGIIPRVSPFVDVKDAGRLLQAANFKMAVASTETIEVNYSSVEKLFYDIQATGQSSVLKNVNRGLSTKQTINRLITEYKKLCNNKIVATFEIIILIGSK
jgi:ubiquinone/menaquinone biosynthesis C-methylase UbiE